MNNLINYDTISKNIKYFIFMVKNMAYNQNTTKKGITVKGVISTAFRFWKILVPIVLAFFILFTVYSAFIATPMYQSTAKLYIINKESTQVTSTDFNISTYLTKDFAEILQDEVVLSEVSDDINNKYSAGTIKNYLNITATEDTRIIEITVTSPNAKDSKQIADSICRISEEKLAEIMGLDRVKVIRNGNLAKSPSSPNVTRDAIFGILVGLVIAAGVVFAIMLTDNKISSAEDVEKILDISILTTIPYADRKTLKK